MQRSITSFFKGSTAKNKESSPPPRKRRAMVISSDEDDDVVPGSPQVATKSRANKKTRTDPLKSPAKTAKKPTLSKLKTSPKKELKRVDPADLFGGEIQRIAAKKVVKPKEQASAELDDADIDSSLMELDVEKCVLEATQNSPSKAKETTNGNGNEKKKQLHVGKEEDVDAPSTSKKLKEANHDEEAIKPSAVERKKEKSTPKVKKEQQHHSDLENSVLSDEERHDRKRMAAILYQKYKNRSSCINPGSKEVPKGKPNCLAGLTFLITGVLESLERDEAAAIIKDYGGKVMTTLSKRLNYLIVGEDAGPKKLAQADEFGIKVLSEDGFFDLIRAQSNEPAKTNGIKKEQITSPKVKKAEKSEKHAAQTIKQEKITPTKSKLLQNIKQEKVQERNNNEATKLKQRATAELNQQKEIKAEPLQNDTTENADEMLPWVDKYKPTSVKEIIGQQGAASNVNKLMNWLSKWYINHDGKKKLQKPNPWAKNDDGSYYKAALLSGPPGIGKTTTATLVCKELGFDAVEFNASDTRSKRLLKEEVSELLSNKSLYGYFHGKAQTVTKKHVLIMDEVDGMAGNEDRGGIQELIALIKDSSVPIICMCNDRNHQKMRSLVNYCYDLRFNKPRLEQIKGRILSICCREHVKLPPAKIEEIIAATNNDIRQTINHISLLSAGKELNLSTDAAARSDEKTAQKDLKFGPWEVVRKVFSADEHKHMTLYDKSDLFFHDYSLGPLFVHQNYLQVSPVGPKSDVLNKIALTADALSMGDLVDKRIRSNNAWSLLPTQAFFSSVMPGEYMCGHFTGQINFPGWLGKYSRSNKRSRLAQELHDHTRLRTSGSRLSIRMDYAPFLLSSIVRPLKELGLEGVPAALHVLKEYHLLREDIDSLIELTTWPGKKSIMDAVDGRVKAALTRAYNKEVMPYTYSASAAIKKKKAEAANGDDFLTLEGEDGENAAAALDSDEEEKADDLESDGLIKAKKKTASTAASKSKASTSKAKSTADGGKKSTTAGKTKAAKK